MVNFVPFPKIHRLMREVIITEKIDGTNARVTVRRAADAPQEFYAARDTEVSVDGELLWVRAGSRNRWLTRLGGDNFGFGQWVYQHAAELAALGPGTHFGEWWGRGIQRGYGIEEKRFSLFDVERWRWSEARPACCDVVPVLVSDCFDTRLVDYCLNHLRTNGSVAAPGYMNPEGVVIYHVPSGHSYKCTLGRDGVCDYKVDRHD